MKTKAILFDKDGTLCNFDAYWIPITVKATDFIARRLGIPHMKEKIMESFGVTGGVADINGELYHGTYSSMASALCRNLKEYGMDFDESEVTAIITEGYHISADCGVLIPNCSDIVGVMKSLYDMGIELVLATNDDRHFGMGTLKHLGIYEYFSKIYTCDDGFRSKPDPEILEDYIKRTGFDKGEIIMVGDTPTDGEFARRGGVRMIGVAESEENARILSPYTDTVISDLSSLIEVI